MMMFRNSLFLIVYFWATSYLMAQQPIAVPINYDNLSFVEEPLATEIGDVTVSVNGLLDQSVNYHITNPQKNNDTDFNTRALAALNAQTQLPNSWDIRAQYIANFNYQREEDYQDEFSLGVSDEWGTVAVGNITGSIREKTRRFRPTGNAFLENSDDFLGKLDQNGILYGVRHNMVELVSAADYKGNFEAAVQYAQPIGQSQYRTSLRFRRAEIDRNVQLSSPADTFGVAWIGGYYYASYLIDAQIGHEMIDLKYDDRNVTHNFASLGAQYKYGAYTFSADGGVGEYDSYQTRSAALGTRIDIARGTSLNFGLNYYNNDGQEVGELISSVRYDY